MKKISKILMTLSLAGIIAMSAAVPATAQEVSDGYDYYQAVIPSGDDYTIADSTEAVEDIVIPVEALAPGGTFSISPWGFEMPTFDNPIDYVYFMTFGPGFEFMQNTSVDINRTINQGNWQLRVLSSVAVAGQTFPHIIWPENVIQFFDEETEIWQLIIEDTGEVIDWESFEEVEFTDLDVYTFLSLRDTAGQVSMANVQLSLEEDSPAFFMTGDDGFFFGHIRFVHYDEENDTAYFAAVHRANRRTPGRTMNISFTIDHIFAGEQNYSDEVKIDLAAMLNNHQASFITEGYEIDGLTVHLLGGGTSMEMYEVLGADFDLFSPDMEIMALNELNVPIAYGIYLTNIDFRDNLLRIQTSQEDTWRFPQESWAHFGGLIDPRVESPDWDELWAGRDFFAMDHDELMAWEEEVSLLWANRYIHNLYNISFALFGEEFESIGKQYAEWVFYIEDADLLNYLAFNVFGGHFEVVQPVNFNISHRRVPVIGGSITIDAEVEIRIDGTRHTVGDFIILPLELSFSIDNAQAIMDVFNDHTRWFNIGDYIQIDLIHADGSESEFSTQLAGWSTGGHWLEDEEELIELRVFFHGIFDIDNISAIRVNGTRIDI